MDKKSEENIRAAKMLISAGYYSSSIHCSYYALFQYIVYALDHCGVCSYTEQKEKTKDKGSHDFILSELRSSILDQRLSRETLNLCYKLKRLRVRADYKTDRIKGTEAQQSLDEACDTITVLKNYFSPNRG